MYIYYLASALFLKHLAKPKSAIFNTLFFVINKFAAINKIYNII